MVAAVRDKPRDSTASRLLHEAVFQDDRDVFDLPHQRETKDRGISIFTPNHDQQIAAETLEKYLSTTSAATKIARLLEQRPSPEGCKGILLSFHCSSSGSEQIIRKLRRRMIAPQCLNLSMTRTRFSITVDVPAPPPLVWSVMTDVERWPEWTPSISRVKRLSPGPLQLGSRVRIHQPRLPPALWRVIEVNPCGDFAWVSVAPGVRVTARHAVEPSASGSRVTLSIRYEGWLGAWLARWTGTLNERYLAMEANGLKARCTEVVVNPELERPGQPSATRRKIGDWNEAAAGSGRSRRT